MKETLGEQIPSLPKKSQLNNRRASKKLIFKAGETDGSGGSFARKVQQLKERHIENIAPLSSGGSSNKSGQQPRVNNFFKATGTTGASISPDQPAQSSEEGGNGLYGALQQRPGSRGASTRGKAAVGNTCRSGFGWKAAESGKVFKSSERAHGARKKSAKGSRERRGEEGRGAMGVLH